MIVATHNLEAPCKVRNAAALVQRGALLHYCVCIQAVFLLRLRLRLRVFNPF